MIRRLQIQNFKCFENYDISFDRLNILVGGNNSGKTTVFHALKLAFWSIIQVANKSAERVTLKKTQTTEIPVVPYTDYKDIFYRQQVRTGNAPTRIRLTLTVDDCPDVVIEIYSAFGRNLMIAGADLELTHEQYNRLTELNPVYVPGTIGITGREDLHRAISLDSMIQDGRQNQVIRNMVYQLRQSDDWEPFVETIQPLFSLNGLDIPCLLYTSPSPRDATLSRMPSSA